MTCSGSWFASVLFALVGVDSATFFHLLGLLFYFFYSNEGVFVIRTKGLPMLRWVPVAYSSAKSYMRLGHACFSSALVQVSNLLLFGNPELGWFRWSDIKCTSLSFLELLIICSYNLSFVLVPASPCLSFLPLGLSIILLLGGGLLHVGLSDLLFIHLLLYYFVGILRINC